MAVPGQWEDRRRTISTGEVARWGEPVTHCGTRVAVSVVIETAPTSPLPELS